MSLMTCGAACACGHCGGYGLAVTVVTLCAAPGISVLYDEPPEGTGSEVFLEMPSNTGAWFAKYTSCVTPLLESVLDRSRSALLTFSLFLVLSAWSMPNSFF